MYQDGGLHLEPDQASGGGVPFRMKTLPSKRRLQNPRRIIRSEQGPGEFRSLFVIKDEYMGEKVI
jgi:hypothetical protein